MSRPATVILDIPVRSSPLSNGRLSKSLTRYYRQQRRGALSDSSVDPGMKRSKVPGLFRLSRIVIAREEPCPLPRA